MKKKKKQYYIANHKNTKFLCSTNIDISSITHEFDKAMIFQNATRPGQIIRMLPKVMQKYGPFEIHVVKDTSQPDLLTAEDITKILSENKTSVDLQEKTEVKVECKKEFDFQEIKDELNSFAPKLKSILDQQEMLKLELSNIDLEISDILHYIEFHRFSACDGYKLAKMIQVASDKRREIKKQLEVINIFKTSTCTSISSGHLINKIDNVDDKIYRPRILNNLFENGKNKERENIKVNYN